MAKAKLHAADGAFKSDIDLPASHFEAPVSEGAMFNVVDVYMGNQRQGTHKTKNRSEVSGGGKKPWKQKGTGRARQGSNTAPQWVRGGKAHGPLPHLYKRDINKKVKRRSLLSALTVKANESSVYVIEKLALAAPKTKDLVKVLATAKLDGQKNLIVVAEADKARTLWVNPADAALLVDAAIALPIEADPSMTRGTVRVETSAGWIEHGRAVYLNELRAALGSEGDDA